MKEEARMNSRTSALLRKAASGYEPSAADKSRTRAAIGRRVAIGVAAGGAVAAGAKTAAAAPAALVPVATTAASVPAAAGVAAATGAGFAPAFTTAFASTFTGALTTKVIATVAILGTLSAGAVTVRHVAREHAKAASSVSATATAQQVQPTTSTTQAQTRATQTRATKTTPESESESVAATPINVAAAAAVDSLPVTAVTTIANPIQNKQNKPSSTTTIQSPALQTGAEVELIQRAQQALEAGDATAALVLLSEHARRFPNGALSEERDAARVLALCGAGQQDDAEQMGAAFLGRYPSSPLASRVRASCAGPSSSPHAGSNAITN